MTKKKQYPGGVKLTLKKARAVAIQEFGTAKGLEKEEPAPVRLFHNGNRESVRQNSPGHIRRNGVHCGFR